MNFQLFRQHFSRVVDHPAIKFSVGLLLLGIFVTSLPFSIIAADDAKQDYCRSHNCNDSSEAYKSDQYRWGVNFGIMLFVACVIYSIACGIVFCHTDEQDQETQQDIENNTTPYRTLS